MFDLIALAAAIILGFAAGLWDLKTSDIPDEAPALMATLGLFIWYVFGLTTGNWMQFVTSAALGTVVFAIGWGLYKAGQWGGGDAALLAGIFFLLPDLNFLVSYVFNFFVVALVYSVFYSIVLGLMHPEVFGYAADEIKKKKIWVLVLAWLIFGGALFGGMQLAGLGVNAIAGVIWLAGLALIVFYVYARAIEKKVFREAYRFLS